MSSRKTKDLIELVEKRAGEPYSANEAQQLIQQGADIREPTRNGSMIDVVINQMKRHRETGSRRAQYCDLLVQVLQNRASDLLAHSILSDNGGDLNEIMSLIGLHAKCYQSERFGRLGLLGEFLKQSKIPIRFEIVKVLVDHYAEEKHALMNTNDEGQTCLSLSMKNPKCPKEVQKYLQNTFDMILNQIPFTCLQINADVIIDWIYAGANPEAIDDKGNTVLCNAVIAKNQQLVDKLVGVGCNTTHKNKNGLTPLQIAENTTPRNPQLEAILQAQYNNIKLKQLIEIKKNQLTFNEVNALLEDGAKINAPITNGSTLLHLLIANEGSPEIVAAFVNDFHADVSAMDIHGHRPAETCVLQDKDPFKVLQMFLQLPKITTNTYFNTKLNKSILQFAQEQKRPEAVVKIIQDALNLRLWNLVVQTNTKDEHNESFTDELHRLISYGAQIEHKHSDKVYQDSTVLHLACKISTKKFVQYLIEQENADYTSTNGNGDSPLSIVAEHGQLSIMEYLHQFYNVPLNVSNKKQQTPLHLATGNHHLLVVQYLVLWGADHQAKNAANQTALDVARVNVSKNKKDETTGKAIIVFLEQLICPKEDPVEKTNGTKPTEDLDTCELVKPVSVLPIQQTSLGDEEELGNQKKGFLTNTANENLLKAAKEGLLEMAVKAIGDGANICHQKNNLNAYHTAVLAANEYYKQSTSQTRVWDMQQYQQKMIACKQIMELIRQTAYNRLLKGIENSNAYHVVAFHQAGALLYGDLLSYACNKCDNIQIIDYLINNSEDNFRAMSNYSTDESPYQIAKKNNFHQVASYLKYRLSAECTDAIQRNDVEYVEKLLRAGASADMHDTHNLRVALGQKNAILVEILCKNGVKMPIEWRQSTTITLPENVVKALDTKSVLPINRSLVDRRLRLAAAQGDLTTLIRCIHLSADINSENCYGSTALLCSLQYGNYFSIVHALVSRGGTILHSNADEPMSLIVLAKNRDYTQIANYLSKELNTQFLRTIQNNDIKSARKFEGFGPNFNYQDELKRTPLHHAVRYHGIELVKWLCACGSTPTLADIDGNFPMTEAVEKGDYAVVQFFATAYPATKQQRNKANLTALQLSEKLGFQRIAYFLRTGQPAPDSMGDDDLKPTGPKHSREELINAAKDGHLIKIKEFVADQYESRDEKRRLCFELIDVAKKANQPEVVSILQPYYNKELKGKLESNIESGSFVTLNERYKKLLLGFLTGLGEIIAGSPVVLDPTDPQTYKDLFSHLTANQRKRSDEIHRVSSEEDAANLSNDDLANIDRKSTSITNELSQLYKAREMSSKTRDQISDQLKELKELTATQRQELMKQRRELQNQSAVLESSIMLYELQLEATITRQKTVKFIKTNTNMYLFFRTIENQLQALFHAALALRSGLLSAKTVDQGPISLIPFSEVIGVAVKSVVGAVVAKLKEKEQKKEYYNISTMGNIEELNRLASDTASLLTLYYKEQIELIDTSGKISSSNMFNEKIHWIKEKVIDVRPEDKEKMPVVIVAEYITALVMEGMKYRKKYSLPEEPMSQQLWLHVAKTNCVDKDDHTTLTDILGSSAGRRTIPIKYSQFNGVTTIQVQLRHLIGCVSVVNADGQVYEYKQSVESSNKDFMDLRKFGYVYISPFVNDESSVEDIKKGRNLTAAKQNVSSETFDRLKKIEEYVRDFQEQGDRKRQSLIKEETARQIAEILREKKVFVDPKDMQDKLYESQQEIEANIDELRKYIKEKSDFYETSLEATNEKLQKAVAQAIEKLEINNEKHYQNVSRQINEQFNRLKENLEHQMTERWTNIEKHLEKQHAAMRTKVEVAQTKTVEALKLTNQAAIASEQSAQRAEQSRESIRKIVQSCEMERIEYQTTIRQSQVKIEQTINEQKTLCEQAINAMQTKYQIESERMKATVELATSKITASANAARETAQASREIQKDTKTQLDLQKEAINQMKSQMLDMIKSNQRLADDAKRVADAAARKK